MRIFVDADSCAKICRQFIEKKCLEQNITGFFAANRTIPLASSTLLKLIVCPQKQDAADDYIVENSEENDIAVTRDLGLVKRLMEKNVIVLNDKGKKFTPEYLNYMLEERELSLQMKSLGISNGGKWNNYGQKELEEFKKTFSLLIC